jgi:hypothetical protein
MAIWSQHPDRDEKWAGEERSRVGDERFRREHECISGNSVVTLKWPDGKIKQVTILELKNILSL